MTEAHGWSRERRSIPRTATGAIAPRADVWRGELKQRARRAFRMFRCGQSVTTGAIRTLRPDNWSATPRTVRPPGTTERIMQSARTIAFCETVELLCGTTRYSSTVASGAAVNTVPFGKYALWTYWRTMRCVLKKLALSEMAERITSAYANGNP